jgi:hypothetical protein
MASIANTKNKYTVADVAEKIGHGELADVLRVTSGAVAIPSSFEAAVVKAAVNTKLPAEKAMYNDVLKILRSP